MLITRIWHGKTKAEHADEYLQYMTDTASKIIKKSQGILFINILRRMEGNICHFWTLTKWDSIESIKKFAGRDYERAKYYPRDKDYLLELEPNVIHCETFEYASSG